MKEVSYKYSKLGLKGFIDTPCPNNSFGIPRVGSKGCSECSNYVGSFKNKNIVYCEADENIKKFVDMGFNVKYRLHKLLLVEKSLLR
jgi:hypothetical protein